jgi:hypothetical protein
MSPEEARAILLQAFAAQYQIPAELLAIIAEPDVPRKPRWRRLLRL